MNMSNSDSVIGMDISLSPSVGTQCPENFSPPPSSLKTFYSKIISCQRTDKISCVVTPKNRENFNKMLSPFVKRKVPFNPFNQNLKERLENPVFSPSVFSTVISPSRDSEEFKWTIDDLSKINPVPIEEEFHFEEQVDEKTESEIQNTIDKYFTKTHMVPSPWDSKLPTSWRSFTEIFAQEKQNMLPNEQSNQTGVAASSPYSFSVSRLELISKTPCQNVSTQTGLSLPPDLPDNIYSALKPYLIDDDPEDINLSMNLLRRKLLFDEPRSPVRYLTVKEVSPSINNCCPSTPVVEKRTEDSPLQKFSPLDVSPICRIDNKLTCNNSSYSMQVDSPILELQKISQNSVKNEPTNQNSGEECFKVFESPKLAGGIRRKRKRRRSFSQDINMSVSSSFDLKFPTKQSIHKLSCCEESKDISNENFTLSQDTGYGSECTDVEKYFRNSNPNFQTVPVDCWKQENKENVIIASTPTK